MGSDKIFHKRKERTAKELARRAAKKSPYETVLIVCEGEKTEVGYFKGFIKDKRLNTANVEVMPSAKGSAPINIVEFAIQTAESREGIDKVFCVFDQDNHASYDLALEKLKNHKPSHKGKSKPHYHAIVSSPCFEIWLLLHFTYTTKPYSSTGKRSVSDNLIADLRQYMPNYTKSTIVLFELTREYLEKAIANAKKLKNDNGLTGSIHFTDVYILVEYLISLSLNN